MEDLQRRKIAALIYSLKKKGIAYPDIHKYLGKTIKDYNLVHDEFNIAACYGNVSIMRETMSLYVHIWLCGRKN